MDRLEELKKFMDGAPRKGPADICVTSFDDILWLISEVERLREANARIERLEAAHREIVAMYERDSEGMTFKGDEDIDIMVRGLYLAAEVSKRALGVEGESAGSALERVDG